MMRRTTMLLLLAAATMGCATAAPEALSPQLEEHQRLANVLRPRTVVHGGWAPEDNLGLVEAMPFWKGGFGGLDIWLRGDIVGTPCGQYIVASLLALRAQPKADARTVDAEAMRSLTSVGFSGPGAEAARASCPGMSQGGGAR